MLQKSVFGGLPGNEWIQSFEIIFNFGIIFVNSEIPLGVDWF